MAFSCTAEGLQAEDVSVGSVGTEGIVVKEGREEDG